MRILALDPGVSTGWAIIDVEPHRISAVSYGVIPIIKPGIEGLVSCTREFLNWAVRSYSLRESSCDVVFEEMIKTYKVPTMREALEVRGVIRDWCVQNKPVDSFAYDPNEIRRQLGLPLKGKVKTYVAEFVKRVLGYKPVGPDHVTDAFAVGIAHAVKTGVWHARITLPQSVLAGENRSAPRTKGTMPDRMSSAEYLEMLRAGKIA